MTDFEAISINQGPRGTLMLNGRKIDCFFGKGGVTPEKDKREGDSKSPLGAYPIRKVYWRADKGPKPQSPFETIAIEENFGWCDEVKDENYNKFVLHPYPASAEKLWRDDDLYDIIVVLGHNDNPVVKGMGSAIFLHCTKENYAGSLGCLAISNADLRELLDHSTLCSRIIFSAQ